jgi:putative oxidoreductase
MPLHSNLSTPEAPALLSRSDTARLPHNEGTISHIGLGARLALAGVFLWAGIRKVAEPELFLQDIESYELLPYRWAWLISIWLPFLEIAAAAALLTTRRWAQAGATLIGAMLLVFLVAIFSAWSRGLSLSCGCFGASDEPANYPWLVVRDLLMLGLVVVIFSPRNTRTRRKTDDTEIEE